MSHLPLIILGSIGIAITFVGVVGIWRRSGERPRHNFDVHPPVDDLYDQADDDIIAVRKKTGDEQQQSLEGELANLAMGDRNLLHTPSAAADSPYADDLLVINIFPQQGEVFSGFELLQAILTAGLRHGDMHIFHRYQELNGKGPILFSLASATSPGTFDMQKMGTTSCQGLTMFMRLTFTPGIDAERFELMLNAARQIETDLNGRLLDSHNHALSDAALMQIQQRLSGQVAEAVE